MGGERGGGGRVGGGWGCVGGRGRGEGAVAPARRSYGGAKFVLGYLLIN